MTNTSTMFYAFGRCRVTKDSPLVARVVASMERHVKSRKGRKGWHANLSYRTYQALVKKGVMTCE